MTDISYKISRELADGKLPPDFVEEHQIVDPEHPAAQAAAAYVEKITHRLLRGRGIDPQEFPLRILLVKNDQPNAFMISRAAPPIVAVSTGLVASLEYEDELAGIARHEIEHRNLYRYRNTKVQEWLADQSSVDDLEKAGYNSEGLIRALKRLPKKSRFDKKEYDYMDEHPDTDIRIRDLENHNVVKARKEGALTAEWTELDLRIKETAQTASMPPRFMARLLQGMGYDALPPAEKIAALVKIYNQEIQQIDPYYASRVRDYAEAVQNLPLDLNNPLQRAQFNELIDCFVHLPKNLYGEEVAISIANAERFYKAAMKAAGVGEEQYNLVPLGRLAELNEAMKAFVESSRSEEAEKWATVINDMAAKYDFGYPGVLNNASFFRFPWQELHEMHAETQEAIASGKQKGIETSWTPHIVWAQESRQIRHALERFGLGYDRRLLPLTREEREAIQHFPPPGRIGEDLLASIYFNEENLAIGIGDGFEKRLSPNDDNIYRSELLASEIKRMALRDQVERRLVETIDWSRMETDFEWFVGKYKKYLIPEITVAPTGGDVFAIEFLRRLEALEQNDKNKPHTRWFFQTLPTYMDGYLRHSNLLRPEQKFACGIPIGVNLEHPFIRYALANPDAAIEDGPRAGIISFSKYLKQPDVTLAESDRFLLMPEHVYGAYPSGLQGLLDLQNNLTNSHEYTQDVLESRLYACLVENKNRVVTPAEMLIIRQIAEDIKSDKREEVRDLVLEQAETQAKHDLRPEMTAHDIANAYVIYSSGQQFSNEPDLRRRYEAAIMERAQKITDLEEKEKLAQILLHHRKVETPIISKYSTERETISYRYTGQIRSHDFRDWSINLYVDALQAQLGEDNGSNEYYKAINNKIESVIGATRTDIVVAGVKLGSMSNSAMSEILPKLADAVNAQPTAAFRMREIYSQRNLATAINLGELGGGVELSIDELAKDPEMRRRTIDFLTTPLSRQTALVYGKALHEHDRATKMSSQFGYKWDPERCADIATTIHQNFWRAPLEARGWYLDKILFPPGVESEAVFQEAFSFVMDKSFSGEKPSAQYRAIINRLRKQDRQYRRKETEAARDAELGKLKASFREQGIERGSKEEKQAKQAVAEMEKRHKKEEFREGASEIGERISYRAGQIWNKLFGSNSEESLALRQIAEDYIEIVPLAEKRLLLTAIMAARNVSQEEELQNGRSARPGAFAAQVLSHLDEMGGKILQGINSHSGVSQEIKEDTRHAKSDYNRPKRWDAIDWCQQHGIRAETPGQKIIYYGRVIASGSMGFTMFNKMADGSVYADTLLRPHARGRSEREANNMVLTAKRVAEKNPKLSAAVDIAEIAKYDARIETCMSLAYKQGQIARQIYQGLQTWAIVEGKEYHLAHETADVTQYSEGAKRARVIQGVEFKKLPENTKKQLFYKRSVAIQLYGMELLNILTGKPCDRDRHGANQKIHGEVVGHFDFGMTALALPTESQKRAMTRTVINAYRDHILFHKNMSSALDAHVHKASVSSEDRHYLSAFKRQMLALGDFDAYVTETEKRSILGSILASSSVDPVIQDQMKKSMGFAGKMVFDRLAQASRENPVFKFDDSQRPVQLVMPSLTQEEDAIIRGGNKKTETYERSGILPHDNSNEDVLPTIGRIIRGSLLATLAR